MDEFDKLAPKSPEPAPPPAAPKRLGRGRTVLFAALAAIAAIIVGGIVTQAVSHDGGRWWGGMGGWHGGMDDPAAMGEHIERMVKHLAIEIDATDDQEAKLTEIATSAAADLVPLRQRFRDSHDEAIGLLTGATVDRAAIEQFRADKLALADTASKRLTQALADAAEVLTPEQRQQLAERIAWFHERRQGGHGE